jgi:uracil-DNA glycosylase family 4
MNTPFWPKRKEQHKIIEPIRNVQTKKTKPIRTLDCSGCGLDKHCQSPRMEPTGDGKLGIFILAEAPGAEEDARGEQLVGKAGRILREALRGHNIDLDRDCIKMNSVNCRPFTVDKDGKESNRTPEYFEVECCRQRVFAEIDKCKPRLILLLGGTAVDSLLGHRWPRDLGGINKWRGWTIPDRDVNAWVCPTFHPSYVSRSQNYEPVVEVVWEQDLTRALAYLDEPLPEHINEREYVQILPTRLANNKTALGKIVLSPAEEDEIIGHLHNMCDICDGILYFDFECNSRKPFVEGRRILTCSASIGEDKTISFPVSERVAKELGAILSTAYLPKAAHNMKFEDMWANTRLPECRVQNWYWDSMIAANVLDNRKGTSGLKFQVYANFGVIDYSSHMDVYMDVEDGEDDKDANAINKMEQAPAGNILLYGGMDSLFGRRLALMQMDKINADAKLLRAYELFHDGTLTMAEAEQNGMRIDSSYVQSQYKHITERRIPAMKTALDAHEVVKKWKERRGAKFNMGSDEQLGDVLVNVLGITLPETPGSSEKKRRYSTSAQSLEDIEDDVPFVKDIADVERLKKVASTNLIGYMREAPDGWLHPFFNLGGDADGNHVVTSYRSSSSNINFQNQPIRHDELRRITRRAFIPRPGMQRLSADFKGIEVATSCCVHHDPNMVAYQTDKTTNMHRDMAMQLMMLDADEWTKDCRDIAKNKFVFPEFYGSYWLQTAADVWQQLRRRQVVTKAGMLVTDHLANKDIEQFRCAHCAAVEARRKKHRHDYACCFENHVRLVEDDFWNKRFAGYTQWKKDHMKEYERKGYFYLLTGFRIAGVLRRNQVLNLPIQGPAFHCLLYTLNRVRDVAQREHWQSLLVGQIHDSGEFDVVPEERDHVIETINRIVATELREAFSWVIVPMEVEYSCTPTDKSWYESKEIK